jgi:hypothetical protein
MLTPKVTPISTGTAHPASPRGSATESGLEKFPVVQ